jgi:hypothetical protein
VAGVEGWSEREPPSRSAATLLEGRRSFLGAAPPAYDLVKVPLSEHVRCLMHGGAEGKRHLLLTSATTLWSSENVARHCAVVARRYGDERVARELEVLAAKLAVAAQRMARLADAVGCSS